MRSLSLWLNDHSLDVISLHQHRTDMVDLLRGAWVGVLLVLLGAVALITAVILSYPVVAHIAAKFFQ